MDIIVDVLPHETDDCEITPSRETVSAGQAVSTIADARKCRSDEGSGEDLLKLVSLVRRRDEAAARLLMEQLHPRVLKIVRGHLPGRMSEEDLVQMVFIKVFGHIDQFKGQVPFEHWVSRIAVNTCFSALKAEKARPECRWSDLSEEQQHIIESLASQAIEPQETFGGEVREVLHRLMSRLSPAERLVINLLHIEEKSVAEVRDLTGWSAPLVKVRAFRARKKLQRWLRLLEKEK